MVTGRRRILLIGIGLAAIAAFALLSLRRIYEISLRSGQMRTRYVLLWCVEWEADRSVLVPYLSNFITFPDECGWLVERDAFVIAGLEHQESRYAGLSVAAMQIDRLAKERGFGSKDCKILWVEFESGASEFWPFWVLVDSSGNIVLKSKAGEFAKTIVHFSDSG